MSSLLKRFTKILEQMLEVGRVFFINVVTEYVKGNRGWKLEQPSLDVTASTSKAPSQINGLTLHSAFHLQVNGNDISNSEFCPPCKEVLQEVWSTFWYLKIIIHNEYSMTE